MLGAIVAYRQDPDMSGERTFGGFLRYCFPRELWVNRNVRIDVCFVILNRLAQTWLLVPASLLIAGVSPLVLNGLTAAFGARAPNPGYLVESHRAGAGLHCGARLPGIRRAYVEPSLAVPVGVPPGSSLLGVPIADGREAVARGRGCLARPGVLHRGRDLHGRLCLFVRHGDVERAGGLAGDLRDRIHHRQHREFQRAASFAHSDVVWARRTVPDEPGAASAASRPGRAVAQFRQLPGDLGSAIRQLCPKRAA